MTELPIQPESSTDQTQPTKHYRIRKELVWLISVGMVIAFFYPLYDNLNHINWPPHVVDPTNQKFLASLTCKQISAEPIPKFPSALGTTVDMGAIDRSYFFTQPQCAVIPYLSYEGSGARVGYTVYDSKSEQALARVQITFTKK